MPKPSRDPVAPAGASSERVIARLEPLLLERRVRRMQAVLAGRSSHVAFVFERMTDPHNLSAALRSLDAFSFQDVHLVAPGERLGLSHLITRGTDRWLTLHTAPDSAACLAALQAEGYRVYASEVAGADCVPLTALDFSRRTALVFGNEHAGVSDAVPALADGRFHIPMRGFAESLNLSVAVAISAFHARREVDRLRAQLPPGTEQGDPYVLSPERRRALYAEWLQRSVNRSEEILAR